MKRILPIVILVLGCALPALGQRRNANRNDKAEEELRNLVRAWDDADVRGDAAAMDRLLADEFAFVGGIKKAEYLASVKSKSADTFVESAVSGDLTVQIYGDTAVVTGVDTVVGKYKGQPYRNRWLFMDVWVKRDGRWQCVKTYACAGQKLTLGKYGMHDSCVYSLHARGTRAYQPVVSAKVKAAEKGSPTKQKGREVLAAFLGL